jgi:hypothetical protein
MAKLGTQPPYTTAADIESFFGRIGNKAPPDKLDKDWVENYGIAANQPSGIVAMTKWLGIVDENGSAKADVWNKIRQPASRAEALDPLVREGYSAVFGRISVEEASREDLYGAFIDAYGVGDPEKKVKCFLTLCEYAYIKTAAEAPKPTGTTNGTKGSSSPKPKAKVDRSAATPSKQNGKKTETVTPVSTGMTIALNVEIPAAWTEDEVRERIALVSRAVREAKVDAT